MEALISPKWVYKTGKDVPLIYYFYIPNNKEPFTVYLTKAPTGTMKLELSDSKLFPNGFFKLAGNDLIFIFPWILDANTLAGFYEYELVTKATTQLVKLAVIEYTYEEILTSTKFDVASKQGPGWNRVHDDDKSCGTEAFISTIISAVEKTHWEMGVQSIDFWDWSGPNGTNVNDQYPNMETPAHPGASHKNGIAVDMTYVKNDQGVVDWKWFTALMKNVVLLSATNFRFIINDVWYQSQFWPGLSPSDQHLLFPHISRESGHGGHQDHTHFNFVYY